MPGMVEPHSHLSYINCASVLEIGGPADRRAHVLHRAQCKDDARYRFHQLLLGGLGQARIDIVIRNEINAGNIPGPRYRAASPEIVATGGLWRCASAGA